MSQLSSRVLSLSEGIAESTSACLLVMVQGNMLAITMGHLAIASETGIIAGLVATTVALASNARARRVISLILGAVTAVVDYFVHPGAFGPAVAEALVTGMGAGLISFMIGIAVHRFRARA